LQPRFRTDEHWQAGAREMGGEWWVVTNHALIIASSSGQPTKRVPRQEVLEVRSTEQHSLYVRTAKDGHLIGSFTRDNDIANYLGGDG
jgi:hypothetical protein